MTSVQIQDAQSLLDQREFQKGLLASLSFHLILVFGFGIKFYFFSQTEPIQYQSAVRVDLIALPDKTAEIENPQETTPAGTPAPVAPPAPTPAPIKEGKIKNKTSDKIDLAKKNRAIEKLKALQRLEQEAKNNQQAQKNTKLIKGNVISAGTALRGISKLEYDDYIGSIDSRIKANWQLPEWLAKANLRARAIVMIDQNGNIISKKLVQSSGNATYDSLTLDAIDRSAPFPAPPEKFVDLVGRGGIQFQFPD